MEKIFQRITPKKKPLNSMKKSTFANKINESLKKMPKKINKSRNLNIRNIKKIILNKKI